ncbi:MAG TPA: alpha/beta fold hydrolase [Acidobacteriaceae bacterium]|nr:alpha/beta fold hydrolase [Acidobacteriaceae bacterium]
MKLIAFALVIAWCLSAWAVDPEASPKLVTPDQIYALEQATQPPDGITWSPDGTRVSYIDDKGDLVAIEGSSGKSDVLIDHDKMKALLPPVTSEQDRNNRSRYKEASYFWAPDSKHLLFDSSGQLWLFDLATGTGLEVASTGAGSGDDPKFSPDGAWISYVRDHNLWVRRLRDTNNANRLTDSQADTMLDGEVDWVYEEELDVRSNYFWSPDSRRIAYLQMNEASVPEYPITDWIPTHASVVRQRYPQPGDPNPAVRIGVVGANGGRTRWINLPIDGDNDYIPRFGWLNSKTLWIETLTRDHKKLVLYFADPSGDQSKPVLTETDSKFLDESYDVTFFQNNFLLTSWRDGHNHLYLYSFDGASPLSTEASLVKQLTSGNWEVSDIAGVDQAAHRVYYLSNEGDPRQQQIWAVGLNGEDKHQVSHSGKWHEPVFSPNAKFFVDVNSSTTTPPMVTLCSHQTDCQTTWKAPFDTVLTPPEAVEFKAADGVTVLYGYLALPSGKTEAASLPLIVNPYGGPHAQTVTGKWSARERLFDQLLLQNGFAVLHVDNRGMGGRGREFAQAAFHNFGPVQFGDQIAALDQALRAYPQLDPRRLGWWGWSWGGTFTLYALTHSDRFRAGVAVAPVTNWEDYDSIYTERYLGRPAQNADVYSEDSVVNAAANLKGRLLLIHGTGDDNVHLENTIQFIQKLIDFDLPYDLQLYPRKTHGIDGALASTHLYTRILAHFQQYLAEARP